MLFEQWSQLTDLGGGRSTATSGIDIYELADDADQWTPAPTGPGAPKIGVIDPIAAGSKIIAISSSHCPYCRGPGPVFPAPSLRFDPKTGTWRAMRAGPVDTEGSVAVWTGDALVRLNPTTYSSGPGTSLSPGEVAAWDPGSDAWTRLPSMPTGATDVALFWTGHEILAWGDLFGPGSSQHLGYRYQPPG